MGDHGSHDPTAGGTPEQRHAARRAARRCAALLVRAAVLLLGRPVVGATRHSWRENFVDAFDAFTGGAAASAAGDLDLLTANRYRDASSVRPTRLDARLSFLVDGKDVVGASARVDLRFEADLPGGDTVPFTLKGRLLLEEDEGTWSVFGYDVARDDAAPVGAEVTP
jgi:hypothetical protein